MRRVVEEIWNLGALDLADALFTPDYVNHGGLIPDLTSGPESIKVSVALFRAAFPDLYVSVESLANDGDDVMLCWTAHSAPPDAAAAAPKAAAPAPVRRSRQPTPAHDAEKAVATPDGRSPGGKGTLPGTTRFRFTGHRIVESWMTWDEAGVLQRLGLAGAEGAVSSE